MPKLLQLISTGFHLFRNLSRRALQHTGQLRDGVSTASARSASVQPVSKALNLDEFDPTQVQLLEEQCILVDEQDRVLGSGSKKDCHLLENINKGSHCIPQGLMPSNCRGNHALRPGMFGCAASL